MSGAAASIALLSGAWVVLTALGVLVIDRIWPHLERSTAHRHPRDRAALAWAAAAGPVGVPGFVLLLCLVPGLAGYWSGAGDHCSAHLGHPHLCLLHGSFAMSTPLWIAIAALAAAGARLGGRAGGLLWSAVGEDRRLRRLARDEGEARDGAVRIASKAPLALTSGLWRPRVWISQGLDGALSAADRAVVLAHERAHVRRRDPLRFVVAATCASLYRPAMASSILATLRLATEQICDDEAARVVGDPLRVASTLLRVERTLRDRRDPGIVVATGVGGSTLPERIERLLCDQPCAATLSPARRTLGIAMGGSVMLALPIHHAAEHLLESVLRLVGA